jgi:hypothetical protein
LATGELSLSVAALLEPYLSDDNQSDLLAAVAGQSVRHARERLAERFPRPDAPSCVRKLPATSAKAGAKAEDRTGTPTAAGAAAVAAGAAFADAAVTGTSGQQQTKAVEQTAAEARTAAVAGRETPATDLQDGLGPEGALGGNAAFALRASTRRASRVEPLSADRYRVQFTAGPALKQKLELARDWMRHRNPDGEFAPIIDAALDALLERLKKQRFGGTSRRPKSASSSSSSSEGSLSSEDLPVPTSMGLASNPLSTAAAQVGRATRRKVSERDGLCCSWVGEGGKRCASRAWLEFDHHVPRGKGGGAEEGNVRLLCRAHNQLSAELHYGRRHMERVIRTRKPQRTSPSLRGDPSSP